MLLAAPIRRASAERGFARELLLAEHQKSIVEEECLFLLNEQPESGVHAGVALVFTIPQAIVHRRAGILRICGTSGQHEIKVLI